jgi:hypothetical protein
MDAKTKTVAETPLVVRDLYKYVVLVADNGGITVLLERGSVYKLGYLTFLKADAAIREKHIKELECLLEAFYEFDALFSMARAAAKYGIVFPYSNHCHSYN